jgi:hypothetical protein
MSKENNLNQMFGVKYCNHDFFTGEDDFYVNFEDVHAIYCQDSLDISLITIWIL